MFATKKMMWGEKPHPLINITFQLEAHQHIQIKVSATKYILNYFLIVIPTWQATIITLPHQEQPQVWKYASKLLGSKVQQFLKMPAWTCILSSSSWQTHVNNACMTSTHTFAHTNKQKKCCWKFGHEGCRSFQKQCLSSGVFWETCFDVAWAGFVFEPPSPLADCWSGLSTAATTARHNLLAYQMCCRAPYGQSKEMQTVLGH